MSEPGAIGRSAAGGRRAASKTGADADHRVAEVRHRHGHAVRRTEQGVDAAARRRSGILGAAPALTARARFEGRTVGVDRTGPLENGQLADPGHDRVEPRRDVEVCRRSAVAGRDAVVAVGAGGALRIGRTGNGGPARSSPRRRLAATRGRAGRASLAGRVEAAAANEEDESQREERAHEQRKSAMRPAKRKRGAPAPRRPSLRRLRAVGATG